MPDLKALNPCISIKADNYIGFYEYLFYGQHPSVARIDEASFLRKAFQCLGAKHGTILSEDDHSFLLSLEQPPPPPQPVQRG